eukprot:gene4008-7264_t
MTTPNKNSETATSSEDLLFNVEIIDSPEPEEIEMVESPEPEGDGSSSPYIGIQQVESPEKENTKKLEPKISFKIPLPRDPKIRSISLSERPMGLMSPRLVSFPMEGLSNIPIPSTNLKKIYRSRPQLLHKEKTFWNEIKTLPLLEKIEFSQVDEMFQDVKNTQASNQKVLEQLSTATQTSGILDQKQISNVELILKICKLTPEQAFESIENFCDILFTSSFDKFFFHLQEIATFQDTKKLTEQIKLNPLTTIAPSPEKCSQLIEVLFFQQKIFHLEKEAEQKLISNFENNRDQTIGKIEELYGKLYTNPTTSIFIKSIQPTLLKLIHIKEFVTRTRIQVCVDACKRYLTSKSLQRYFKVMKELVYFCHTGEEISESGNISCEDSGDGFTRLNDIVSLSYPEFSLSLLDYLLSLFDKNEKQTLTIFKDVDPNLAKYDEVINELIDEWSSFEPLVDKLPNDELLQKFKESLRKDILSTDLLLQSLLSRYQELQKHLGLTSKDCFSCLYQIISTGRESLMDEKQDVVHTITKSLEPLLKKDNKPHIHAPKHRTIPNWKFEETSSKNVWNLNEDEMDLDLGSVYYIFILTEKVVFKKPATKEELEKLSIKELTLKLRENNIDYSGCVEKSQFVQKVLSTQGVSYLTTPLPKVERRSFTDGIVKFNKTRESFRTGDPSQIKQHSSANDGEFKPLDWEIKSNSKKNLSDSIKDISSASFHDLKNIEKNKELMALTDYLANTVIPISGTLPKVRDKKEIEKEDIKYLYEFQTNVKLRSKIEILDLSKDLTKIMIESVEMKRYLVDILTMLKTSKAFQNLLQYHFILMMYFTPYKNRGTSLCSFPITEIYKLQNLKSDTKSGFSLLSYITSLLNETENDCSFATELIELKRIMEFMKNAENNELKIEKILQALNDYQLLSLDAEFDDELQIDENFDQYVSHLLGKGLEMNNLIKESNEKCEQQFIEFREYYGIKSNPSFTSFFKSLIDLFEKLSIEQKSIQWRQFLQRNKNTILADYADPHVTTTVELVLRDGLGNIQKTITVQIPTSDIERDLSVTLGEKEGTKTILTNERILPSDPLIDPILIVKGGLFSLASSNPSVASLLGNPAFNTHINSIQNCVEANSQKSLVDLENESSKKDVAICARQLFIGNFAQNEEELEKNSKALKIPKALDNDHHSPISVPSPLRVPLLEHQLSKSVPVSPKIEKKSSLRDEFVELLSPRGSLDSPSGFKDSPMPERRSSSAGTNSSKLGARSTVSKRHSGSRFSIFGGGFFGGGKDKGPSSTIQDTDIVLDESMTDITFGISVSNKVVPSLGIALSGYGILNNYKGEVNSKVTVQDISHHNNPNEFPVPQSQTCRDTQQIRIKFSRKMHFRHMIIHIRATDKKMLKADDIIKTTVYNTKTQEIIHSSEIVVYPGCTRWMSMYAYKNPDDTIWRLRNLNQALLGSKSSIEPLLPLKEIYEPKSLVVRILKAEDILGIKNGTSDPYCQIYFQFSKQKFTKSKTKVLSKTTNPEWNQHFSFPLHKDELNPNFIVEVWDYSQSKFLGQIKIPLQRIEVQRIIKCKLSRRDGALYLNTDKDIKGSVFIYFDVDYLKDMCDNSDTKLFGVELNEIMIRPEETEKTPLGIQYLIDILKKEGPNLEGIFRVPGKSEEIEEMIDKLEYGDDAFYYKGMVNAVGSTLKQYLREMPVPLMTYDLYEDFILLSDISENDLEFQNQISVLIKKIPQNYQNLLFEVMDLAKCIEKKSKKNKMNAENLATVLGVNLLRSKSDDPFKQINDISKVQKVFAKMIQLYPTYFNE